MEAGSSHHSLICGRIANKYPIDQAGMGFAAHMELATAVCNAGGLDVSGRHRSVVTN